MLNVNGNLSWEFQGYKWDLKTDTKTFKKAELA